MAISAIITGSYISCKFNVKQKFFLMIMAEEALKHIFIAFTNSN